MQFSLFPLLVVFELLPQYQWSAEKKSYDDVTWRSHVTGSERGSHSSLSFSIQVHRVLVEKSTTNGIIFCVVFIRHLLSFPQISGNCFILFKNDLNATAQVHFFHIFKQHGYNSTADFRLSRSGVWSYSEQKSRQ